MNFSRDIFHLTMFLALLAALIACGPAATPTPGITLRTPDPSPTLEPTFTPAAPPTHTPSPSPSLSPTSAEPTQTTALPEPTPPAAYQVSLLGRILDQVTGQPVAGARVSVDTFTTMSDADGRYTLTELPPGQYVLSVTHEGYDPALSPILTLNPDQLLSFDLELYATDTTPYPKDPMLTNPLDPNGAPTAEDAERLARLQGLTGEVVRVEETQLTGEYLVNYKREGEVRAAVAELNHDVWALTDEAGRTWWIIKVCGNLASPLPGEVAIATPEPRPLLPQAEVAVDGLSLRDCASEECAEVGMVPQGVYVDVFGCLAASRGGWCEVGWSGGRGWCTGRSLQQLAVAGAVPVVEAVLPTARPGVVTGGAGRIVFSREDPFTDDDIYVMNADGSGLTQLTNDSAQDWHPAWSPDGQRIAFLRDNRDIYVMNADGSGLTSLISGPDPLSGKPHWSPDGRQIVYSTGPIGGGDDKSSIYVINTDGSGLFRLTDGFSPTWSPDGRQIVFNSNRNGTDGVYVMNADGSRVELLTDDPRAYYSEPTWSPNDKHIVFRSNQHDVDGIYVINADGSDLRLLTELGGQFLTWSPNGRWIAFTYSLEIYVINIDGSGLTRLTNNPDTDKRPTWSPDSRKIAYTSYRETRLYIYVMNVDGSDQTRLSDGDFANWSQ